MKSISIITLILGSTIRLYACMCIPLNDKSDAEDLCNNVEFIFYGHAVKSFYPESELNEFYSNRNNGYNVIMKVDSVIKGDLCIDDNVLIFQNSGNCDELLEFGIKKLVLGEKILKFKSSPTHEFGFEKGLVTSIDSEYVIKTFNRKLIDITGVWTMSCYIYTPNSKEYRKLINWIE